MSDAPVAGSPTPALREAQRVAREGHVPVMFQRWSELLFLHWSIDPQIVQETLPQGLTVDTFEGKAWIGLVPFRMSKIRPRGLPAVPWISAFPEMNVRTYVHDEWGRPGVWFYSLDAARWVAVQLARRGFSLPYHHAAMSVERDSQEGWIDYHSRRFTGKAEATFRYRGVGPETTADPESLEFFLVERYLLFASTSRGLKGGYVNHPPYRFRDAEVTDYGVGPVVAEGLPEPDRKPDHMAYVESVDVSIFGLESL